jgi:hypothetical protein
VYDTVASRVRERLGPVSIFGDRVSATLDGLIAPLAR